MLAKASCPGLPVGQGHHVGSRWDGYMCWQRGTIRAPSSQPQMHMQMEMLLRLQGSSLTCVAPDLAPPASLLWQRQLGRQHARPEDCVHHVGAELGVAGRHVAENQQLLDDLTLLQTSRAWDIVSCSNKAAGLTANQRRTANAAAGPHAASQLAPTAALHLSCQHHHCRLPALPHLKTLGRVWLLLVLLHHPLAQQPSHLRCATSTSPLYEPACCAQLVQYPLRVCQEVPCSSTFQPTE